MTPKVPLNCRENGTWSNNPSELMCRKAPNTGTHLIHYASIIIIIIVESTYRKRAGNHQFLLCSKIGEERYLGQTVNKCMLKKHTERPSFECRN